MLKNRIRSLMFFAIIITLLLNSFSFFALADEAEPPRPTLNNFKKVNIYTIGLFTDVDSAAWYSPNVATAYELGLMKGSASDTFGVSGNITIAETIALATRIDSIFCSGTTNFVQGDPWYQCYVDYAVELGMVDEGVYSNYNSTATRAEFATILSVALPSYALKEINWIEDNAIPDVAISDSYGEAVYLLYRAGILTGSDTEGSFNPQQTISRTEVAAIVTRMADESLRKSINLVGEY